MGKVTSLGFSEVQHTQVKFRVVDNGKPRDVWSALDDDGLGTCVLMQSTGLKDKNGVEIFEGDIVILTSKSINYADTYWHNYAEVFQQTNGAYRLRGKGIYETELYGNRKQVTLTGNIYETPELLENDRFCTETDDPDY